MQSLHSILSDSFLPSPDGRPLYAYSCSPERLADLERALRLRVGTGQTTESTAAAFVFWASEYIRARFAGGRLTWALVFGGLGLAENRDFGLRLVDRGLGWWGRKVRVSQGGIRMSLYTLMAEGGLPQVVLTHDGQYRRAVLDLMAGIEAEGGMAAAPIAERMAARVVMGLPQTFQGPDFARLLCDLVLALVELRATLPADLPPSAAERWLDANQPGWAVRLPLRMSPDIAEALIRPALNAERGALRQTLLAIAQRGLQQDNDGRWHGLVSLAAEGWLPSALLPKAADGLRLRLISQTAGRTKSVTYTATPEPGGWQMRRFGQSGPAQIAADPSAPFALAAFADGQACGEAMLDPGLPSPDEAASLWRAADQAEGGEPRLLIPQPGSGRTRAGYLWLLAPEGVVPQADPSLTLDGPYSGPGGDLWRATGAGSFCLGAQRFRVQTGADEEAPEAYLYLFGPVLAGWRLADGSSVYCGRPAIYGAVGAGGLHRIGAAEQRLRQGRLLGANFVEWLRNDELLVRMRFVSLPEAAKLTLREEAPGRVVLVTAGLPDGWRVNLHAGGAHSSGEATAPLALAVPGAAPGLVSLRLSDPATGTSLELVAPWPARSGMVLDPQGARLDRNLPLAAEALVGWRAIVPPFSQGYLQFRLVQGDKPHPPVSLRVSGHVALAAHLPLIRALLAQGGLDALVNLRLVVGAEQGFRLELGRYHEKAVLTQDVLRAGLGREVPWSAEADAVLKVPQSMLELYAVDLGDPARIVTLDTIGGCNLRDALGEDGGPWLIQSRHQNRVQRGLIWSSTPLPHSTRKARIATYRTEWLRLVDQPESDNWSKVWRLIAAAGQGGDAGVLDQVQALAGAPAAAVALALRVPTAELPMAMALEGVAPLFWPVLPISAFTQAMQAELSRQIDIRRTLFEPQEAADEAGGALANRIGAILSHRPELAGHFGMALVNTGLISLALSPEHRLKLAPVLVPNPVARLEARAQDAARRFDRLPDGVVGIVARYRSTKLSFSPQVQPLIDAPLVAAEMAVGLRPAPDLGQTLTLINLRLVDTEYFDAALPAAIAHIQTEACT